MALARPQSYDEGSSRSNVNRPVVQILRDDRIQPEGGSYSFDFESEDGIVRSEQGSALTHLEQTPTGQQGTYS